MPNGLAIPPTRVDAILNKPFQLADLRQALADLLP